MSTAITITQRTTHQVQQGSPEWLQLRTQYLTASEAPAAQSVSRHTTRSELVHQKATGITPEHDRFTLGLFAKGHRAEAAARPLAEAYLGEDLGPVTMTARANGLPLLASLDGITFAGDVAWECKLWNEELAEQVRASKLAPHYTVQMDQQQLVSGATRTLFTCSDGTPERTVHCWYASTPESHTQVVTHWAQLQQDVAAYNPAAERPAPAVAAPVESLPAVVVNVTGALAVAGNLDKFGEALRTFIGRIPAKPATDQQFADAEAACKALKKAEDALDTAEAGALSQISDVEQMRRSVADLKALARTTRLATEKLVAAEKDARRTAIVTTAQGQLDTYVASLNQELGANWLPRTAGGFGEVIKGKKSLDNMQDAVTAALVNAKAALADTAQRLKANRAHLVQADGDWVALFADFATVGTKAAEDFEALAQLRIDKHKAAEAARLEAQREQIRKEEAARIEREAAHTRANEALAAKLIEQERQAAEQKMLAQAQALQAQAGQQAQAAIAQAAIAPAPAPAHEEGATLTLGQINVLMAPIKIDGAGLAELGFAHSKTEKGAKHYPASSAPQMLTAMIQRLQEALATA